MPTERESRPLVEAAPGTDGEKVTSRVLELQRDQVPRADCCQWGLRFADGNVRCYPHATEADRRLVNELDGRGLDVGLRRTRDGRWGQGLAWPYGPNVDVAARARMLDWAGAHGLQLADPRHRCLDWLRGGRCARATCRSGPRAAWMDHVTAWTHGGKPAAFVAQPYHLSVGDVAGLDGIGTAPELSIEIRSESWYGHGAWFVGIWRAASEGSGS